MSLDCCCSLNSRSALSVNCCGDATENANGDLDKSSSPTQLWAPLSSNRISATYTTTVRWFLCLWNCICICTLSYRHCYIITSHQQLEVVLYWYTCICIFICICILYLSLSSVQQHHYHYICNVCLTILMTTGSSTTQSHQHHQKQHHQQKVQTSVLLLVLSSWFKKQLPLLLLPPQHMNDPLQWYAVLLFVALFDSLCFFSILYIIVLVKWWQQSIINYQTWNIKHQTKTNNNKYSNSKLNKVVNN